MKTPKAPRLCKIELRTCCRACPVDIKEVYDEDFEKLVMTRECIMCLRCVELYPQEDCLKATMFGKQLTKSKAPPTETGEAVSMAIAEK